jgi:hypothetical protein
LSRRSRSRLVAAVVAALTTGLTAACTIFAAAPLYGSMRDEFHWQTPTLAAAGVLSLAISAVAYPAALVVTCESSVRLGATAGSLGAGLLLLLALPNLTHFWQFVVVLAALGLPRSLVFSAGWMELRRHTAALRAALVVAAAVVLASLAVTPWLSELVYRNSWREGAAAAGGALLLIATPLSYVLLPGHLPAPDKG